MFLLRLSVGFLIKKNRFHASLNSFVPDRAQVMASVGAILRG